MTPHPVFVVFYFHDFLVTITVESNEPIIKSIPREPPRIDGNHTELPSAETIKQILMDEQKLVNDTLKRGEDVIEKLASIYELTYAFVAEFQKHNIPIFLGYGSHIGARRHHGIIPLGSQYGDKDVDFLVFSLDGDKVQSIINDTLRMKSKWSKIEIHESEPWTFGYQIRGQQMKKLGYSHYFDFWLLDDHFRGDKVKCIGLRKGCDKWYRRYQRSNPPVFDRSSYFPPLYQVFGTHKVLLS